MASRQLGLPQTAAAAKAGFSERSARNIGHRKGAARQTRSWRTRQDPLAPAWEEQILPKLKLNPTLLPITFLELLQETEPERYPDSILRTLERRVKTWKALEGPEKVVMFRQQPSIGLQGLSDFTQLKDVVITIQNQPLEHLLYHFRLAFSGWSYMRVTLGGESFTALAEGLQEALWRLGGSPLEHRTDSLSAAFKNLTNDEQTDITSRYEEFCQHYGMKATRNNRGVAHENGAVESPHGHLKRRIKQALLLRDSNDFESVAKYQSWLAEVVNQNNRRNAQAVEIERAALQPLPQEKTADFTEICARVSSSSTIDVRKVTYTVPSRLEGEIVRVHLYHDRLLCYLGSVLVVTLPRIYPKNKTERARCVDYRHVIHSLVKKPQAFRYSQIQQELLPTATYKDIWKYIDSTMLPCAACKLMVGILYLAAKHDCELSLGALIMGYVDRQQPISLSDLQQCYGQTLFKLPEMAVPQHSLASYDQLFRQNLPHLNEVHCG